jgi:hypothetical protein
VRGTIATVSTDRLKTAARAIQNLDPMIRYRCLYRGKVIAQNAGNLGTVDVRPYDPMLPDMAGIPLRHGVPGLTVQVVPGCSIEVGFDDGRPDRPYAALWSVDASAVRVVLSATSLELGGANPTNAAVLGTAHFADLITVMTAIGGALTTLGQVAGGLACTSFVSGLPSKLSTTVRVK